MGGTREKGERAEEDDGVRGFVVTFSLLELLEILSWRELMVVEGRSRGES